jgi:hypothetical protein
MTSIIITIFLLGMFFAGLQWGDSSKKWAPLFFIGGIAFILLMAFWMAKLLYWVAAR